MPRACLALLALALTLPASAQETAAPRAGAAAQGWEAVGRLDLGGDNFCTGALVEPDLVLTAAHCLFEPDSGMRVAPEAITFRAGWRDGRAVADRGVRRAIAHPAYDHGAIGALARMSHDIALIELDGPVAAAVQPFALARPARDGDVVGVVSYARERAEAPALDENCLVMQQRAGVMVLSCAVDFGASGAPVFAMQDGTPRIVSVVSAKAELGTREVALSTAIEAQVGRLTEMLAGPLPERAAGAVAPVPRAPLLRAESVADGS